MKIEILKTVQGSKAWEKGMVFDDAVSPIPGELRQAASRGFSAIKVIAEDTIAVTETETEIQKPVVLPQENTHDKILSELEGLLEKYSSEQNVAEALGVSYQTVHRWLNGKNKPGHDAVIKISEAYAKVNFDDSK